MKKEEITFTKEEKTYRVTPIKGQGVAGNTFEEAVLWFDDLDFGDKEEEDYDEYGKS